MSRTPTRTDPLKAAHEKLTEAIEAIVTGEDWQRMLKTAARFHRYSFQNQLLVFCQRPDATVVAGFNRWKSLGRFVKKGEKGIAIFAPCRYKVDSSSDGPSAACSDCNNNIESTSVSAVEVAAPSGQRGDRPKTEVLRGFRLVPVFDISQTEGEELPDLDAVRPKLLDADAPEGIWEALVAQADGAGFEVIRNQRGNENGYCDFLEKVIAVRPDVSATQAVKTLIHELGHALLHSEGPVASREVAEVEVESVAYIVCDALGVDAGDYSFPYVTRWPEGSVEVVKETAERVVTCARAIVDGLVVSAPDRAA